MNKIFIRLFFVLTFAGAISVAEEDKTAYLPAYIPQNILSPAVEAFINGSARIQAPIVKKAYNYDALGRVKNANSTDQERIAIPIREKMRVVVAYLDVPDYDEPEESAEYISEQGKKIYKLNGKNISEDDYFKSVARKETNIPLGFVAEVTAEELRNLINNSTHSLYVDEYEPSKGAAAYTAILDTSLVTLWAHSNGYKGDGIGVMFVDLGCPKTSIITTNYFVQNGSCSGGITKHATSMVRVFQTTAPKSKLFEYNEGTYPAPSSTTPPLEIAFFPIYKYNDSLYRAIDASIDNYIYNQGLILFTAAGNQNSSTGTFHVSSPGKAVNSITVGGIYPFTNQYESFSRWKNSEIKNQKPEVANYDYFYFPGDPTFIDDNGDTYNGYVRGTSTATAYTAGIMADILQQHPFFKGHPEMAKALLITGSTKSIPNASSFDQDNNSKAAKWIPLYRDMGWNTRSRYWNGPNSGSFVNDSITFTESNIVSGKRYRIAISWLTPGAYISTNKKLSQDIDLYIKQNGNIIAHSASARNPFEVVDFVATSSSDLTIIIERYANSGTGKVALGYNMWSM